MGRGDPETFWGQAPTILSDLHLAGNRGHFMVKPHTSE
jgi:hypothetical protein